MHRVVEENKVLECSGVVFGMDKVITKSLKYCYTIVM